MPVLQLREAATKPAALSGRRTQARMPVLQRREAASKAMLSGWRRQAKRQRGSLIVPFRGGLGGRLERRRAAGKGYETGRLFLAVGFHRGRSYLGIGQV